MRPWAYTLFGLIACLPASAQTRKPEPTPAVRIDLHPYGYRTEGVKLESTQLVFLTEKLLAVKVHQEIPNPNPSEECKQFLARLGKYASFPACQYAPLPVQTLVFDAVAGTLHAQGETKNRYGEALFLVSGGRFIAQTENQLVLYSADLTTLTTYPFVQSTFVSPEMSPDGSRIGILEDHKLVVLDAATLTPVGTVQDWGENYFVGPAGVLIGRSRKRNSYSYVELPGGEEHLIWQDPDRGYATQAEFLTATQILILACRKKVIVSASGQVLCTRGQPCWKALSQPKARVIENHLTFKFWTRVRHFPLEDFGKLPEDLRFVRVWDTASGKRLFELKMDREVRDADAALSPDGLLVALIRDGHLEVYRLPAIP